VPNYGAIKAAIAALSPMPVGPDAIAGALNAQTVQAAVPFAWSDARLITQLSGSWSKVVLRSRLTDGGAANLAAINAYEMDGGTLFEPSNTAATATLAAGLTALLASGDITQADVTAIQALAGLQTVPVWVPPLTAGDVQTAEAQP
jgi:hypothetical protein